MSQSDLKKAFFLIENNPSCFSGPKTSQVILEAEKALGVTFPPTYREFLHIYGDGDIAGVEFFGIPNQGIQVQDVSNSVWLTLDQRKEFNLPHQYILISYDGMGNYFALDSSQVNADGEYPVVICYVTGQVEYEAEDFGAFMRAEIEMMLEDEE